MYIRIASLLLLFAVFYSTSCNKSTTFGGDLYGDQAINTTFTDTVRLQMRMVAEDSVYTSDPNSTAEYLLCGAIEDPILGSGSATIYSGIQLSSLRADFKNTKLDSIVLYLGVRPNGTYGDTTKPMQFEVRLLDEHPSRGTRYYSHQSLPVSSAPGALIGTGTYLPTPSIGRPIIDTTTTVRDSAFGAWFSMRLDQAFGEAILGLDSATLNNDTLFWAKFKGVQIKSSTPGSILGIDLNDRTFSRMTLYYKKDTANAPQRVFNVQFIGENKFVQFERSPSSFITDRTGIPQEDNLLALQGLGGYKLEVEIPHIAHPEKQTWAVNTAEIILYAASVPGDNPHFWPAKQLSATVSIGDTSFAFVPDISYSLSATGNNFSLFGGEPVSTQLAGTAVTQYKLSIPSHLQDMILGRVSSKFFINLFPQVRSGSRVIVHSPGGASPLRARLNLRYTQIN